MKKPQQATALILLVIIGAMLILKLSMSLNRQFDPDEFAYLHWAYLLTQGKLPYKDFFFIIAPSFLQFLTPLFLLPQGPIVALVGRLVMYLVYLGTLGILYIFTKCITKNTITALLTVLIFTVFPMTFDKTIEIRPDMVMVLLFFVGIKFLLSGINSLEEKMGVVRRGTTVERPQSRNLLQLSLYNLKKIFMWSKDNQKHLEIKRGEDVGRGKTHDRTRLLFSGICFSLSFLVMFKIIFALPAVLFLLLGNQDKKTLLIRLFMISVGMSLPLIGLFVYLSVHSLIPDFITGITSHTYISNAGNNTFSPLATLSPWPLIYVTKGGISLPWVVNTVLWIIGIPNFFLFIKAFRRIGLFLLFLFVGATFFVILFPKPYVQYFIIPTAIASITIAYALTIGFTWIQKQTRTSLWSLLILFSLAGIFGYSFFLQYQSRIHAQNEEQLGVLADISKITRPDEPVYDMVGSYIYRPDSYYICCLFTSHFFADKVKPAIPTLSESLIASKTKFLVMDQKGYVFWQVKPEDLAFMTTHYLPSAYKKIYTLGSQFQCRQGSCIQLNVHGQPVSEDSKTSFDIMIEEQYKMHIQPDSQRITINNSSYANDQTAVFVPGIYRFSAPSGVTSFSIQLDR